MFASLSSGSAAQALEALTHSLAVIEFTPDGHILTANENFCRAMGYDLAAIRGQHHSIFMDPAEAQAPAYQAFWARLKRGEHDSGEYRRRGQGGREVWIKASYNPVKTRSGRVLKVIKQATDITADKLAHADVEAKLTAIGRAQAVIEFTPGGQIIAANENFLRTLGYQIDEIKGQHHRMFVEPAYAASQDYSEFWRQLNAGEFVSAEFMRLGKGGRKVWIQASYNPVFDLSGKVVKVVKFATDITERVRAVREIGRGLNRVAGNDLSYRIAQTFVPAFEPLRQDFNTSLEKIEDVMRQITGATAAIQTGTSEVSTAAEDLSRRTETQAASLEQTAAALDEITSTVRKAAADAAHAGSVVTSAREDAEAAGAVVRRAVTAMQAIESSSRQVNQIIGVIDEIAFQTNLLALNAGVEAARAGEAGRGFAVVAQEVRGLAQRSAEAAKEIKTLIAASEAQVEEGVSLVGDTGGALARIATQVAELNTIVGEMVRSAHAQSTALHEVNIAVNQMDKVTQQNAAMVEETAAATRGLATETNCLQDMVGVFQLGGGVTARPANGRVVALKTVGRGGAASRPDAAAEAWRDF